MKLFSYITILSLVLGSNLLFAQQENASQDAAANVDTAQANNNQGAGQANGNNNGRRARGNPNAGKGNSNDRINNQIIPGEPDNERDHGLKRRDNGRRHREGHRDEGRRNRRMQPPPSPGMQQRGGGDQNRGRNERGNGGRNGRSGGRGDHGSGGRGHDD